MVVKTPKLQIKVKNGEKFVINGVGFTYRYYPGLKKNSWKVEIKKGWSVTGINLYWAWGKPINLRKYGIPAEIVVEKISDDEVSVTIIPHGYIKVAVTRTDKFGRKYLVPIYPTKRKKPLKKTEEPPVIVRPTPVVEKKKKKTGIIKYIIPVGIIGLIGIALLKK